MADEIDIQKATTTAKNYLIGAYGPIAEFTFKVHAITPNAKQNVWKVYCETYATPKDTSPTKYLIRVDVATGKVLDVQPPDEHPESKT